MFLPNFLCQKIHRPGEWTPRFNRSTRDHEFYRSAFFCLKCRTVRFIEYRRCPTCKLYLALNIHAEHVANCDNVDLYEENQPTTLEEK